MNQSSQSDSPPRWVMFLIGCLGIMTLLACIGVGLLTYGAIQLENGNIAIGGAPVTATLEPISPRPTATAPASDVVGATAEQASAPTQSSTAAASVETPTRAIEPTPQPLTLPVPDNISQQQIPASAYRSLDNLWQGNYPAHDYYEVKQRFDPFGSYGSRTINVGQPSLNDSRIFIVDDDERPAKLRAITDHFYFWFEDGLNYDTAEIDRVIMRLETELYPSITRLFGSEWSPGVDGDPHISILHLADFGEFTELGYFDSINQYPLTINYGSNEQEMLFMNLEDLNFGGQLYFGTLVHELEHLVQWNHDSNEVVWLDEGLAQLGEIYTGFDTAETSDYFYDTSIALNSWDYDEEFVYAHYAVSYIFSTYLWERLGDEAIRDLVADPANGFASVRNSLAKFEPETSLEQLLADWTVANWLDDDYTNPDYEYASLNIGLPETRVDIDAYPAEWEDELAQYGVHYITLSEQGDVTFAFAGDSVVPLFSGVLADDEAIWFVPTVDNVDARLTRSVDLRSVDAATLQFSVWYDLEEDFDFAYIEVSADGGQTWEFQVPGDPSSGDYGAGWSGQSSQARNQKDGWLADTIVLNEYAGQEILLRFETLTDTAFTGHGFALKDVRIDEIGWVDSAESDASWQAEGFVRVGPSLPQQWSVQLIQDKIASPIPLNSYNQTEIKLTISDPKAVLIIMPQTPFVNTPANYWFSLSKP